MKTKEIYYTLFYLLTGMFSLIAQEEVKLPDHKPLLGEVHYGNRVGGVQAQEGKSVVMIALEETDVLSSIQVFLSERNIVSGFQFHVEKKDGDSIYSFGNFSELPQAKFIVPADRRLIGISGTSGWFIDSIAFVFDDGSTTPKYGGSGGDLNFRLLINKKPTGEYLGRVMGFWGSYTDVLETIGLVFWPIE